MVAGERLLGGGDHALQQAGMEAGSGHGAGWEKKKGDVVSSGDHSIEKRAEQGGCSSFLLLFMPSKEYSRP